MTLKYESEILFDLMKRDGDDAPSDVLPYESELKEKYLHQVEEAYPKLQDYRPEWLNYNLIAHLPADFPAETLSNVTEATVDNVVPYAYGSAILKGNTKYRDIDTGDILDTFDETKNLELVSVKMPVLTTSNEDGTKTNILSTSEDVELRGIGGVKDELNLLTGEVVERIGEIVLDGSQTLQPHSIVQGDTLMIKISDPSISFKQNSNHQESWDLSDMICDKEPIAETSKWNANEWNEGYNIALISSALSYTYDINSFVLAIRKSYFNVQSIDEFKTWLTQNPLTIQYKLAKEPIKTVDLTVTDQDGNTLSIIRPIEGTMHLMTEGDMVKPLFSGEIPVEAITQNLSSFIEE